MGAGGIKLGLDAVCGEVMVKRFPIQGERTVDGRRLPETNVSWELGEIAYEAYAARHGRRQSMERMAERGGFGITEFALLLLEACGHEVDPFNVEVRRGKSKGGA